MSLVTNKDGTAKTSGNDGGYLKTYKAGATQTVLDILKFQEASVKAIAGVKKAAIAEFKKDEKTAIGSLTLTDGFGAGLGIDLSKKFDGLFQDSDGKDLENLTIASIHTTLSNANTANWVGLVDSFGALYSDWWYGNFWYDEHYENYMQLSTSDVYKAFNETINGIVSGTVKTYDQLKAAVSSFSDSYGTSVTKYLTAVKDNLNTYKNTKVSAASSVDVSAAIVAAYDNWIAIIGNDNYPCNTYDSVNDWYSFATADLDTVITATSETNLATKIAAAKTKAYGLVTTYVDTVAKNADGNLLSSTEKAYYDVVAQINAANGAIYVAKTIAEVEAVIKLDGTTWSGSLKDGLTTAVVTLGEHRASSLAALKTYYESKVVASTVADYKASNAALLANYNSNVIALKNVSTNDTAEKIDAICKPADSTGSAKTALDACLTVSNADTVYLAAAKNEALSYLFKAKVENPDLSAKLLAVDKASVTTGLTGSSTIKQIYDAVSAYEAAIDAVLNA